jgi:hypothetical protein
VLAGAHCAAVREQRQAAPLRPAILADLLAGLGDTDLDRRDAAMLATLYAGSAPLGAGRGRLRAARRRRRCRPRRAALTDHGLELELLRSKASQETPVTIAVDRQHNPRAFAALERWIAHAGITPSTALFRRINPRGGVGERITADVGVNRAVKAVIARYYRSTGVPPEKAERLAARFSGQSGRVDFVVAAKEAGGADTAIAATTRQKSLQMIKRYGEATDQRRCAPHQLKGVGL